MLVLKPRWVRLHQRYSIYSQTESFLGPFFDQIADFQVFQKTFPIFEVRL